MKHYLEVRKTEQTQKSRHDYSALPIGAEIHHVSKRMGCLLDAYISAKVSPELTGIRGMLLGFIVRETKAGRSVFQKDIEARSRVQRSSVTALLKGMEQSGFIARTSVERDARLKSLTPTEKGLAYFDAVTSCIDDFERQQRQGISDAELDQFCSILDRMLKNLDRLELSAPQETPEEFPVLHEQKNYQKKGTL